MFIFEIFLQLQSLFKKKKGKDTFNDCDKTAKQIYSCRTPLKREFCPRFNGVRHVSVGCVLLALDIKTPEYVFFEHPLFSF